MPNLQNLLSSLTPLTMVAIGAGLLVTALAFMPLAKIVLVATGAALVIYGLWKQFSPMLGKKTLNKVPAA